MQHQGKKRGRSDCLMHPYRIVCEAAMPQISSDKISMSSSLLSGRPLAKVFLRLFHTPSSGFSSGAYAGNGSRCRRDVRQRSSFMGSPRWILPLSSSTIRWPGIWRSKCRKNSATSSLWILSSYSWQYSEQWNRFGLTAIPEMAEMRSC